MKLGAVVETALEVIGMTAQGSVYNPVLQSVLASEGKPFNLLGLSKATGLDTRRAYNALVHLIEVDLVRAVGERHVPGQRGRGARLYALVKDGTERPGSLLARVHEVTKALETYLEFTTTNVQERLGVRGAGSSMYHSSSVRLALELLEARGHVSRVLDVSFKVGRGRVSRRWTSNSTNMAEQRKALAEIEAEKKRQATD